MKIIIVGGGIAGLYAALRLTDQGVTNIHLYEAKDRLGGNVYTHTQNGYLMEAGAGRFSAKHTNLQALLKRFDIHSIQNKTIKQFKPVGCLEPPKNALQKVFQHAKKRTKQQLLNITFAQLCEEALGFQATNALIQSFGYNGEFIHTNAYVSLRIFKQDFKPNTKYYSAKEGLSTLIHRMEAYLRKHHVKIHTQKTLVHVTHKRSFTLTFQDNTQTTCHKLILAVPPSVLSKLDFFSPYHKELFQTVSPIPLHRIYAKTKTQLPQDRTTTDLHIRQYIPISNDFAMISYSDGTDADYWKNYADQGIPVLEKALLKELKQLFPDFPKLEWLISFYWKEGVHTWGIGHDPAFVQAELKNIHPNLHIVTEAFSARQGWMEGALEQVEESLFKTKGGAPPAQYVYLQLPGEKTKRQIDVTDWMHQHPGGQGPYIRNMYKDITKEFHTIPAHFVNGEIKPYVLNKIKELTVGTQKGGENRKLGEGGFGVVLLLDKPIDGYQTIKLFKIELKGNLILHNIEQLKLLIPSELSYLKPVYVSNSDDCILNYKTCTPNIQQYYENAYLMPKFKYIKKISNLPSYIIVTSILIKQIHTYNVIHTDLNMNNIMTDASNHLIITDYDGACVFNNDKLQIPTIAICTALYTFPITYKTTMDVDSYSKLYILAGLMAKYKPTAPTYDIMFMLADIIHLKCFGVMLDEHPLVPSKEMYMFGDYYSLMMSILHKHIYTDLFTVLPIVLDFLYSKAMELGIYTSSNETKITQVETDIKNAIQEYENILSSPPKKRTITTTLSNQQPTKKTKFVNPFAIGGFNLDTEPMIKFVRNKNTKEIVVY